MTANQGAHTIAGGGSNRSRGLSPVAPHFNHCIRTSTKRWWPWKGPVGVVPRLGTAVDVHYFRI